MREGVLTNWYYQWVTKRGSLSSLYAPSESANGFPEPPYDLVKDENGQVKFKPIHITKFFDDISPELFLLSPFFELEISNKDLIITDMAKGR